MYLPLFIMVSPHDGCEFKCIPVSVSNTIDQSFKSKSVKFCNGGLFYLYTYSAISNQSKEEIQVSDNGSNWRKPSEDEATMLRVGNLVMGSIRKEYPNYFMF